MRRPPSRPCARLPLPWIATFPSPPVSVRWRSGSTSRATGAHPLRSAPTTACAPRSIRSVPSTGSHRSRVRGPSSMRRARPSPTRTTGARMCCSASTSATSAGIAWSSSMPSPAWPTSSRRRASLSPPSVWRSPPISSRPTRRARPREASHSRSSPMRSSASSRPTAPTTTLKRCRCTRWF